MAVAVMVVVVGAHYRIVDRRLAPRVGCGLTSTASLTQRLYP